MLDSHNSLHRREYLLASAYGDFGVCVMIDRSNPGLGRAVLDLYRGKDTRISNPRVTSSSFVVTPLGNPWTPIHDGTVRDAITLAEWELRIPSYGCACRKDYMLYKASTPPDFTSPESLWLWGFNLHNYVNRKLGKPELTVEEARLQWSR